MTKENKVEVLTPKQAEKLGPQEIVLRNARVLVHNELEETKKLIRTSLDYMSKQLDNTEDFRKDAASLVGIQLQLASISVAVEYWTSKIQQGRIKIYSNSDMPKA